MSTWNSIFGKKNDHVCPYLVYDAGYSGIFTSRDSCYRCKKNNSQVIPKNSIPDLCYDTDNKKDVYETCEIFLKSRNPFSK